MTAGPDVERRIDRFGRAEPHPLPWVLAQIAHAHVENGAADQIDPGESHLVHAAEKRQQHVVGHPRRPQRLLAVADRRIDDRDVFHDAHGIVADLEVFCKGTKSRAVGRLIVELSIVDNLSQ